MYAARIAPCVSSWMTHVKDVRDRISKKTNVVMRSAESMTPCVAPSVSMVNIQYLDSPSRSCLKYSRANRDVPAHMIDVMVL